MRGLVDSFKLLKGLPIVKTTILNSESDLTNFEYPCYLKIDSSIHKLKSGGVLRCRNLDEAKEALSSLKKKFPEVQIVIQEEVLGLEVIIGIKRDSVFGKVLMVGLGGSFVEEKGEVSFRSLPLNRSDVLSMLNDLPFFKSLEKKEYPVRKLIALVDAVSLLVEMKKIEELDLNPVIINHDGVFIVDARLNVSS